MTLPLADWDEDGLAAPNGEATHLTRLASELHEALHAAPPRDASRMQANRSAFLTAGITMAQGQRPARRATLWRQLLWQTGILCSMLLVSLVSLRVASAATLPGDALYPIKITLEQFEAAFHEPNTWEAQLTERRQAEVIELVKEGRAASVDFEGMLAQDTGGQWRVGRVTLDPDTEQQQVLQSACQGTLVRVQGQVEDGHVSASRLIPSCLTVKLPAPAPPDADDGSPSEPGGFAP